MYNRLIRRCLLINYYIEHITESSYLIYAKIVKILVKSRSLESKSQSLESNQTKIMKENCRLGFIESVIPRSYAKTMCPMAT